MIPDMGLTCSNLIFASITDDISYPRPPLISLASASLNSETSCSPPPSSPPPPPPLRSPLSSPPHSSQHLLVPLSQSPSSNLTASSRPKSAKSLSKKGSKKRPHTPKSDPNSDPKAESGRIGGNVRTKRRAPPPPPPPPNDDEEKSVPVIPMAGAAIIALSLGGPVCFLAGSPSGTNHHHAMVHGLTSSVTEQKTCYHALNSRTLCKFETFVIICLAGLKLGLFAAIGGGIMGYTTGKMFQEHE